MDRFQYHLAGVVHWEICVKGFSGTTAPMILKFDKNIGYDYLYGEQQNQHPHAYHFLYLASFLFLQYNFFVKDFLGTTAPRILKFSTNIRYE